MKKPTSKTTKPTKARAQGKPPGDSGVNKPMAQAKVPTKKPGATYSKPSQRQKM